jgi:hypothetical protein
VPSALFVSRNYGWFKAAVFVLLAVNAVAYALFGRATETIDSLSWFVLLALFELETAHQELWGALRAAALVRAARLVAGMAVVIAAAGYFYEREWLDALNATLWIAVVIMLEFEVRYLDKVKRHRQLFGGIATLLYSGLAVLVLAWTGSGEWLDAYDALLWLVAFVAIELNLLGADAEPSRQA